ncbi:hypothetical protein [Thioalkalivibrio sp. ALJT]|uniref:condensin complex protein MksE n=1 Tax=Thioalkalivibrio sp. ALJT TaxID=1158146 RepID=UPI00035F607E|nr:hypothetical protein [Thioalkalivibrio sp. ALJT]
MTESAPNTPPTEPVRGFAGIHPDHSAAIYRQLVAGQVLLRQVYNPDRGALEDNPLYNVVYGHLAHFRELYRHLGLELVFDERGGFFYLREGSDDESEEHDENALKVQVVLLLIGRYYARTGRDLQYLGRPDAGLAQDDLEALAADAEYRDLLATARIDKGWDEAMDFLVARHFAFRTGAARYILSAAGMRFLEQLVEEYEYSRA